MQRTEAEVETAIAQRIQGIPTRFDWDNKLIAYATLPKAEGRLELAPSAWNLVAIKAPEVAESLGHSTLSTAHLAIAFYSIEEYSARLEAAHLDTGTLLEIGGSDKIIAAREPKPLLLGSNIYRYDPRLLDTLATARMLADARCPYGPVGTRESLQVEDRHLFEAMFTVGSPGNLIENMSNPRQLSEALLVGSKRVAA